VFRASVPAVDYRDPWTHSFPERRARLLAGSPRIAYYYTLPDTSTFRYRAFNMAEAIEHAIPAASASWLTAADGDHAVELLEDVDVLVVCRALYAPHVAALIARARALGKRVLFDVDDLIFDDRYTHLVMEALDQTVDETGIQAWFGWIARCGASLRLCDGAITTNDYLADHITRFSGKEAWVIPNYLNRAQLEVSASIRAEKSGTDWARDEFVHLGYFSGTPTHNRDFQLIEPAVAALLAEDPRIRLRIVGFPPQSDLLAPHAHRIETLPLLDFLNLQRAIGDVEINLVPLQDNEFTNCKSELKYFEAAAVGAVTIASPSFTLRHAITDGVTGFLANAQEWYDVIRAVIDRADLRQVAEAAAADALARYVPAAQGPALRAVLDGTPQPGVRSSDPRTT
jgi:glycosyltransferase involved in cell wall biosynthesis